MIRRSAEENRAVLAKVANELSEQSPEMRQFAEQFADPIAKASVLSFLVLDAQLTFYRS
jgi:hypothetical protein